MLGAVIFKICTGVAKMIQTITLDKETALENSVFFL